MQLRVHVSDTANGVHAPLEQNIQSVAQRIAARVVRCAWHLCTMHCIWAVSSDRLSSHGECIPSKVLQAHLPAIIHAYKSPGNVCILITESAQH